MEFLLGREAISVEADAVIFPLSFLAATIVHQAWDRLSKKGKRSLQNLTIVQDQLMQTKSELLALGVNGNRKEKSRLVRKLMSDVQKLKVNKAKFVAGRERDNLFRMEDDMTAIVKFVKGEKGKFSMFDLLQQI